MTDKSKEFGPVLRFGSVTVALYASMFVFERELLALTGQGGWTFLVPIAIAFTLSYFHGNFTAAFWDFFGIKAKK